MEPLKKVKDGQKVLVLFDVKIYEDDLDSPIHLEIDGNSAGFNLSLDFYDDVTGQKNVLYDFDEVISVKKGEPISKDEFEKKVKKLKDFWSAYKEDKTIPFIQGLYDLFNFYHPESFTPEVGKDYYYSHDKKTWYNSKFKSFIFEGDIDDEGKRTEVRAFYVSQNIQQSEEEKEWLKQYEEKWKDLYELKRKSNL